MDRPAPRQSRGSGPRLSSRRSPTHESSWPRAGRPSAPAEDNVALRVGASQQGKEKAPLGPPVLGRLLCVQPGGQGARRCLALRGPGASQQVGPGGAEASAECPARRGRGPQGSWCSSRRLGLKLGSAPGSPLSPEVHHTATETAKPNLTRTGVLSVGSSERQSGGAPRTTQRTPPPWSSLRWARGQGLGAGQTSTCSQARWSHLRSGEKL